MSGWVMDVYTVPDDVGLIDAVVDTLDDGIEWGGFVEPNRISIIPGQVPNHLGEFGWIYVIEAGGLGAVKIGFTASKPSKRIATLQTGCPAKITVRGLLPGFIWTEKNYHRIFDESRLTGEWFSRSGDVDRFVSSLPEPRNDSEISELSAVLNQKSLQALCRSLPVFSSILRDIATIDPTEKSGWCRRREYMRRFVPLIQLAECHEPELQSSFICGLRRSVFARRVVAYMLPPCTCHGAG